MDRTDAHSQTDGPAPGGPLTGTLVVDLTRALAGPHAGMMMADLGARVIKVETPGTGDDTRSWGPPFVPGSDGQDVATYFLSCNRNKESVALDLKSEDGRGVLTEMVRRADVLMENFRPGTGSAAPRSGWPSSTPAWSCCPSPASVTTAPRVAGPATTRSPRARRA